MGLGKSLIAIATALESGVDRVLIVCPAYLIPNWNAELDKVTDVPERFTVISYASLKKIGSKFKEFSFTIWDEVHYLKNPEAQRTKLAHKLMKKHKPKFFLGLSGTPIKNKVPEFYLLLRMCYYGNRYPRFEKFAKSRWVFFNTFSNKIMKNGFHSFEGIKNVAQLKELIKPVYVRKRTKDVIDLPEMVDIDVMFKDKGKIDEHLKEAWDIYSGKKADKTFASGKAVSALAKTKYTINYVVENLEEMGKVIIFTNHVQAAEEMGKVLNFPVVTGKTPALARIGYVESLNQGDTIGLVATIGSLSVGFNITGVNHMVINDYPWVPADLEQAKKRIHRIGQTKTCFYHLIFATDFDRVIWRTLKKKMEILEAMDET